LRHGKTPALIVEIHIPEPSSLTQMIWFWCMKDLWTFCDSLKLQITHIDCSCMAPSLWAMNSRTPPHSILLRTSAMGNRISIVERQ
jgi:hypothetical protein